MRVIECDVCGEVVSAPDDDELVGRLREHAQGRHPDSVPDEDATRAVVARQAYDATDS